MKTIFKKFYEKIMNFALQVPVPIFILILMILNSRIGVLISERNTIRAEVNEFSKVEFYSTLIPIIVLMEMTDILFILIKEINNKKILDKKYMKWIEKLLTSKISTISSIGTGGLMNAINTIAACDKNMINTITDFLPYVIPFITICKSEYEAAGILPIIINLIYIGLMVITNFFVSKSKSNSKFANDTALVNSATADSINNFKTIKYFNKETWSIKRLLKLRKETYINRVNIPKHFGANISLNLIYLPTFINSYLCWDSKSTVLLIFMTTYVIDSMAYCISLFLDQLGEKKSNSVVLGKLEPDNDLKKSLVDSLEIKNCVFKYSESSKISFKIDNISILKGHRYCITGKSGYGKSTFIKLVTKTVEPQIGRIDSVDTIYMFAESEMFNDTVMENITLGDSSVTVSEVQDILKNLEVNLDIDIENDKVGERGELLSTGQRQRINLARVIVYVRRNPNTLVALDEVTSALDESTSIRCINYVASEFEKLGTTLLYVSNKSDYKNSDLITDNIYVIKNKNEIMYVQE